METDSGQARRSIRWWAGITAVGLAALFAVNVYRAATQSLVHDEALTWQLYLRTPWRAIFTVYDNNNHFLSTLLIRLSTALFGFSELAVRLPTLLAGGWYFVTIFRLALLVLGDGPLLLLAAALAAANPLVLDFLVAARGYGLALACLTFGIYCLVRYFALGEGRGRIRLAGTSLALAVAANLTLLLPVFLLAGLVLAILWKRRSARWRDFVLPFAVVLPLLAVLSPLDQTTRGNLTYGAHSLMESWQDLAALSLAHNPGVGGWNRYVGWKGWWRGAAIFAGGAVSLAALLMAFRELLSGRRAGSRSWLMLFASGTVVGSWLVLIALNRVMSLPYPADRTGLYFLPLAGILFPCLSVQRRYRAPARKPSPTSPPLWAR